MRDRDYIYGSGRASALLLRPDERAFLPHSVCVHRGRMVLALQSVCHARHTVAQPQTQSPSHAHTRTCRAPLDGHIRAPAHARACQRAPGHAVMLRYAPDRRCVLDIYQPLGEPSVQPVHTGLPACLLVLCGCRWVCLGSPVIAVVGLVAGGQGATAEARHRVCVGWRLDHRVQRARTNTHTQPARVHSSTETL